MDTEQFLEQLLSGDKQAWRIENGAALKKLQAMVGGTDELVRNLAGEQSRPGTLLDDDQTPGASNIGGLGRLTGEALGSGIRLPTVDRLASFSSFPAESGAASEWASAGVSGGLIGQALGRIFQLFGVGSEGQDQAELEKYHWSAAVNPVVAMSRWGTPAGQLDYSAAGLPRGYAAEPPEKQRVEIRIEALDARSLLDRKEELAEAVRQAVLSAGGSVEPLL